jgi:ubiquinone/menaquinone biosynthesis C-methylase UbiE
LTLDAGCGETFRGDVNVDLYVGASEHRPDTQVRLRNIRNFVNASIEYLPFRDRTFEHVKSYHVIEHVDKPYLALKELIRVSNYHVVIKCPHRFGKHAKGATHKNHFTRTWFVRALNSLQKRFGGNLYFRTGYSKQRIFPLSFLPEEIIVEVFRGTR